MLEIFNIPIDVNRKDSRMHGSYEFPMAVYETRLKDLACGFINWHWHDEMHFYVVKTGQIAFYVNSDVFYLSRGEGLFINRGCMHMVKPHDDRKENSLYTIFVHPKLFSSFQGSVIERKYFKPYIQDGDKKLVYVVLQTNEAWQRDVLERLGNIRELCDSHLHGYELETMLEWMTIWKVMIANIPGRSEETQAGNYYHYRKMKTILTYIGEHYAEKITLDDIARTVNLSRNECCRFFKRNANCTLFQYIMDYRISKGSELLRSGDRTVKEIADEVGFGGVSYFITTFKHKTGYTPKEYQSKELNRKHVGDKNDIETDEQNRQRREQWQG